MINTKKLTCPNCGASYGDRVTRHYILCSACGGSAIDRDNYTPVPLGLALDEYEREDAEKRREQTSAILQAQEANYKKAIRNIRKAAIVCGVILLTIVIVVLVRKNNQKAAEEANHLAACSERYDVASTMLANGDLAAAKSTFAEITDYRDSLQKIDYINYLIANRADTYKTAVDLFKESCYTNAYTLFESLPAGYEERDAYVSKCELNILKDAKHSLTSREYDKAETLANMIAKESSNYASANELLSAVSEAKLNDKYKAALMLYNDKNLESAMLKFMEIKDYRDSNAYIEEIAKQLYSNAKALFEAGDYRACFNLLSYIDEPREYAAYENVSVLRQKVLDTNAEYIENNALKILKEDGFNNFSTYVNSMIDEDLFNRYYASNLIAKYEPLKIASMEPFYTKSLGSMGKSIELRQMVDNTSVSRTALTGCAVNEYLIDGNYNKISGTLFISKEGKSTKEKVKIIIRNQNDEQIYGKEITGGDVPVSFTADIPTGVSSLKIYILTYDCSWASKISYIGGVSDLMLYKVPK